MKDDQSSSREFLEEGLWKSILSGGQSSFSNNKDSSVPEGNSEIITSESQNDWDFVDQLLTEDNLVNCTVTDFNNGGLLVKHEKFSGFIPVSHLLNTALIESDNTDGDILAAYLGKELTVKVIEYTPARERIVLSERAAQTDPGERNRLFGTLDLGVERTGKITNITNFGLFVDLGGIEGLVHISELSWQRVENPRKLFKIGQEVKVIILEIAKENGRVSLSIKKLSPNPWENVSQKYPEGTSIKATVKEIVKFGVFVRLEDGLEGLIHISEMKLMEGDQIKDILGADEQILVELISVDVERQRMSLRLVD